MPVPLPCPSPHQLAEVVDGGRDVAAPVGAAFAFDDQVAAETLRRQCVQEGTPVDITGAHGHLGAPGARGRGLDGVLDMALDDPREQPLQGVIERQLDFPQSELPDAIQQIGKSAWLERSGADAQLIGGQGHK